MIQNIYRYHLQRQAVKRMSLTGLHLILCVSKRNPFHALVRFFTGGPAGHAQVLVSEILPNGEHADSVFVVESLLRGVQKNRMSETIKHYDYVIVYRVDYAGDLSKAYDAVFSLVNKKYDVPQLAFIAGAVLAKKIFGQERVRKWFINPKNPVRRFYNWQTGVTPICSEVDSIAGKAYGAPMTWPNGLPLGFIDPNRLTEVFKLKEVLRLKA